MFNGHIAERREAKIRKMVQNQKKEEVIRRRYHTQIQPLLLEQYDKRLKSFIHKMQQNPIIINPQNLEPKLISQSHFVFKCSEDWRSVYPFRQRQQKLRHDRIMRKMSQKKTVEASEQKQEENLPKIYQFRIRQKSKELHSSMRFGNEKKPPETTMMKAKKSMRKNKSSKKQKRKGSIAEQNGLGGMLRETNASMSNSSKHDQNNETEFNSRQKTEFAYRQETDNIEVQAQLYEKMKEPDEKKMHFKKIADLALLSNDDHEKRELKQILRKSGFARMKPHLRTEQKEADAFSLLIEKMSGKDK